MRRTIADEQREDLDLTSEEIEAVEEIADTDLPISETAEELLRLIRENR